PMAASTTSVSVRGLRSSDGTSIVSPIAWLIYWPRVEKIGELNVTPDALPCEKYSCFARPLQILERASEELWCRSLAYHVGGYPPVSRPEQDERFQQHSDGNKPVIVRRLLERRLDVRLRRKQECRSCCLWTLASSVVYLKR